MSPLPAFLISCLLALWLPAAQAADLHSYAFVQDDGTLRIRNTTVHLYGIHIPETTKDCRTFIRPVKCAPKAVLELDFKIDGFVRCDIVERHRDGSVTGQCSVDGEDLSAYMLRQGWALARPDAPFEYQSLEKIARHQNRGLWGFPVDNLPEGAILPRGGSGSDRFR